MKQWRAMVAGVVTVSAFWACAPHVTVSRMDDGEGGEGPGSAGDSNGQSEGGVAASENSGGNGAVGSSGSGSGARGGSSGSSHGANGGDAGFPQLDGGRGGSSGSGHGASGGDAGFPQLDGGRGGTSGYGGTNSGGMAGSDKFPCQPSSAGSGTAQTCARNFLHRPGPGSCPLPQRTTRTDTSQAGQAGEAGSGAGSPPPGVACEVDADCRAKPLGYCSGSGNTSFCVYGCGTDDDCASTEACACANAFVGNITDSEYVVRYVGICEPAACKEDGECGPGNLCIASYQNECPGGFESNGFFCQTAADECASMDDCRNGNQCVYDGTHFACLPSPACTTN